MVISLTIVGEGFSLLDLVYWAQTVAICLYRLPSQHQPTTEVSDSLFIMQIFIHMYISHSLANASHYYGEFLLSLLEKFLPLVFGPRLW